MIPHYTGQYFTPFLSIKYELSAERSWTVVIIVWLILCSTLLPPVAAMRHRRHRRPHGHTNRSHSDHSANRNGALMSIGPAIRYPGADTLDHAMSYDEHAFDQRPLPHSPYRSQPYNMSQLVHRSRKQREITDKGESFCSAAPSENEGLKCVIGNKPFLCHDGHCVHMCHSHLMNPCTCPDPHDQHCYPCCGNSSRECKPAHKHNVLTHDGQKYQTTQCENCDLGEIKQGTKCKYDETIDYICIGNMCKGDVCRGKVDGTTCVPESDDRDGQMIDEKICIRGKCTDPCDDKDSSSLKLCRCSSRAVHNCHVCCARKSDGKCLSGMHFGVKRYGDVPWSRTGLTCGKYDYTCNKDAVCGGRSVHLSTIWPTFTTMFPLVLSALTTFLF